MRRTTLLLLVCIAQAASAQDLGRLFFTPEERVRLDDARRAPVEAPLEAASEPTPLPLTDEPTPVVPAAPVTVNGLVLRADGPSTAWVNGTPGTRRDLSSQAGRDLRIARDAVEVFDDAGRARVKPGQTFDPAQGRVSEAFEPPVTGTPR